MKRKIFRMLFKFEHFIYCATDCRLELPLHRRYYKYAKKKYESYLLSKQA